jgi:hypothetical protein
MIEEDIRQYARWRAAGGVKRQGIKNKILIGKSDDTARVVRARRQVDRELAASAAEGFHPLRDEEDEPCFAALIERAKARAAELAGTPDADLISELVAAYEHADTTADMIYWNASDNLELPHDA